MEKKEKIPLFWWSETRLMGKKKENYGDLLSRYLVEKISGKEAEWVQPKNKPWYKKSKTNYLAAGSIIHHVNEKSIVWGSGIIDHRQKIRKADFWAVRGPETRKYLQEKGYDCPDIYGDPALLLPDYFNPKLKKKFKLGIIPHYNDLVQVKKEYGNIDGIKIIDMMTNDVEETTMEILECERIISSSLHGVIVSHAYDIPVICVKFSNRVFGDGIKYKDYYASIGYEDFSQIDLSSYLKPEELEQLFKNAFQPRQEKMKELKRGLMRVCPFLKNS